jgi:hypothetical protein
LNPELVGSCPGDLLPPAVRKVNDLAAVVEQRLEDFLHPRVVRFLLRVEADDREHFTGRRDGPLNELSLRVLKCAEQLGCERQRSAGASSYSKKFATIDHERFRVMG